MRQDLALLESWRTRRDAEAFSEIVTRYADLVYGTCLRVLGNQTDAEDATQDCFVRLAENSNRVRTSLGGWLHRMATHQSLNIMKSEARRRQREQRFIRDSPAETGSAWDEMRDWIDDAIDALPDKQREVIVAHFLERRTHQAIADELGITRRAVIYRIQKGVEHLRRTLRKRGVQTRTAILPAAFASRTAEAAPAALVKQLGKLALAGPGTATAVGGAATGGIFTMKYGAAFLALLAGGLLTAWVFLGPSAGPRPSESSMPDSPLAQAAKTEPAPAPASEVEPVTSVLVGQPTDTAGAPPSVVESEGSAVSPSTDPVAVVEGFVHTAAGRPIPHAGIILQKHPRQDGPLDNEPVTHSASDGSFRLANVNPELGLVFADHPDFAPGWTTMNPSMTEVQHVTIALVPGGAIEGRVTVDGQPRAGAYVGVWLGASGKGGITDSRGAYGIERLTPGLMPVQVGLKASDGTQRESMRTAEVAAGMATVVDFDLPPASSSIEGIVTVSGQQQPGGYLRLAVTTAGGDSETYTTSLDRGGRYRFSRVPAGHADMLAVSGGKMKPELRKSVSFDIQAEEVVVRDVHIAPGNCVLSGRVDVPAGRANGGVSLLRGDAALPELTVAAFQVLESRTVARTLTMDGTYEFPDLQPGTYTVIAWLHPENTDNTVDALGRILFDSQVVTLEEGAEEVVDLWPAPIQQGP